MVTIRWEADNRRAAAYDGPGLIGECDVVMQNAFWVIAHTAVDRGYGGQGIAGRLVESVMQAAGAAKKRVKPFCSYAAKLFAENPRYAAMEDRTQITVFGMKSCPDCSFVEEQIRNSPHFRLVDIGDQVKDLKAFLRIRDVHPVFDEAKRSGCVGIPCFVMEDGTVTLVPEEVGLVSR